MVFLRPLYGEQTILTTHSPSNKFTYSNPELFQSEEKYLSKEEWELENTDSANHTDELQNYADVDEYIVTQIYKTYL